MKTRAFTLLELIIVIAVIGVLAALLIPVFSNVIDKANAKSALSDAKNSMEQVIIEGTENEAMPENILIIVKKAKSFYVYGFNRLTDGCLYQSPGNPFKGFSDVQSLINARSWNALQGDTAPDLETAYTDHDTYGYFYLVPYSSGVSQAPTVRGMRATSEYPEISDPINGLMTENMGDDVHIYHGVLTDKVNTEVQTQGDTVATPTPSSTPEQAEAHLVYFECRNYDGTPLNYVHEDNHYSFMQNLELVHGENIIPISQIEERMINVVCYCFNDNPGYRLIAVEKDDTTFTPIENVSVMLDNDHMMGEYIQGPTLYLAVVPRENAPSDNSSLKAGRYPVEITYINVENHELVYSQEEGYSTVVVCYDLDEGTNRIPLSELIATGLFPISDTDGYHYVPLKPAVAPDIYTPQVNYIEVNLPNGNQIAELYLDVYIMLVPNE